jgi:glycerol kinase
MYVLSLDQGTTGTTAMLVNVKTFEIKSKYNKEFPQIMPRPGYVEHNLNDIWATVEATVQEVLNISGVNPEQISCIGITNQRETTCMFNKAGTPLTNAIVWQDRRTAEICASLKTHESEFKKIAGLPLDPYFSGTKIKWLIDNDSAVNKALNNDDLLFGNIDTFLLYKLTGNVSHRTDVTNASRTLLMNLETLSWDEKLMSHLNIPQAVLPEICDSSFKFGVTAGLSFLPDGIPITGILGDQQAALFGQAAFDEGDCKCTYGTGAFMLTNTGPDIKYSDNGLLTTVAYKNGDKISYALEGSTYIAGACVQWLRDNLNIIDSSPEIEELANQVSNLENVSNIYFLPFFTGLGSPYWISDATAAIVGLTRDSGKPELARGALEGICLSINDLISAMESDTGTKLKKLQVDGGAVVNELMMDIQANISQLEVIRPQIIETTAFGAALAALIGANLMTIDEVKKTWKQDKSFTKSQNEVEQIYFANKREGWKNLIKRLYM